MTSFLLRAALAIGALSYLALPGDRAAREADAARASVSAALEPLPAAMRAQAVQAAEAEILRRLSLASSSQMSSQDTLLAADRRATGRGGDGR